MKKSIYPTGAKRKYDIIVISIHILKSLEARRDRCVQAGSWSEIIALLGLEQRVNSPVSAQMLQEGLRVLKNRHLIMTIHAEPHNLPDPRVRVIKLAGGLTREALIKVSEDIMWEYLGFKPSSSFPSAVSTPYGWEDNY